ncbi:hypothetical protein ACEE06_11990 [Staphylococcus epidermidis]
MYSSNPNTDYLIDFLGEKKINKTSTKVYHKHNEKILYINSELSIPRYIKKKYNLSKKTKSDDNVKENKNKK